MAGRFVKFGFKKRKQAVVKQLQIKKSFGFKPTIFRERNPRTGNVKFVVIKAKKMKRLRR